MAALPKRKRKKTVVAPETVAGPGASHHPHGPSSLNFKRMCHAFQNHSGDTDSADEGELMHAATETGYKDALDPEQERMVENIEAITAPIIERADEVHREIRLDMKLLRGHSFFGTCDLWCDQGDSTGDLIDYKFGRLGIPKASDNLQALSYGVGIFQKFEWIDTIRVIFLLPRRNEVTMTTLHRRDLGSYVASLSFLFDKITAKNPVRTACKACEYCALKGECPEITEKIIAAVMPKGLDMPANTNPEDMSVEELDSFALPFIRIVDSWTKAVKKRAMTLLGNGTEMEHHEIGHRTAAVKLLGPINEAADVASGYVSAEDFINSCTLSISRLRAVAKKEGIEPELTAALEGAKLIDTTKNKTEYLKRK